MSPEPINLVDPTGYFSWKKFFAIAASVVVAAFTGQVELPFLVAAAFSTAVVAAATAEGAAIDRALQRSNQSSAAASSPQPSVFQQVGQRWSDFATQPGVARGASFVSGFVPGAGEAKDYAGFRYGIDLITQERLGPWDRGFSGAMLFLPFVGATSVRHSVRALNSVVEESTGRLLKAYRVVGEREAKAIRRTGRIPNTDEFGNPKEVLLSPTKYHYCPNV